MIRGTMGRRFNNALVSVALVLTLTLCNGFELRDPSRPATVIATPGSAEARRLPATFRSFPTNNNHHDTKLFLSPADEFTSTSNANEKIQQDSSILPSLWLFGGIPLLSLGLPMLLQWKLIAPLIVFKRVYIYTLAASVLVIGSIRGSSDAPALGTRLVDLTREVLPSSDAALRDDSSMDTRFQEMSVLDEVDDSTQAVGLPLLVVSSLVASLFFVLLQNSEAPAASTDIPIQSIVETFVTLSNVAVISLFARAELVRLRPTTDSDDENLAMTDTINTVGALALSGLAFAGPPALVWPIQNTLCACLAISVSRAIQIPRFVPIVLALSALVAYDVVSVGIQLVNLGAMVQQTAVESSQQMAMASSSSSTAAAAPSAANSAMGAVALAKTADGTTWQPGLFQVRLRGIATDLLGLGDAVFPSLLSTFCLRFDKELAGNNSDDSLSYDYFIASIVGFFIGCFACEMVPGISDTGLPALLFLVPAMLTSVVGLAAGRGELSSLLDYDPAQGDETETSI